MDLAAEFICLIIAADWSWDFELPILWASVIMWYGLWFEAGEGCEIGDYLKMFCQLLLMDALPKFNTRMSANEAEWECGFIA